MGASDPEDNRAEPLIPTFFTPDDLPSWLRDAERPAASPARETRARAAWVVPPPAHPIQETPFRAAADATWKLLTSPQRHGKRGRRAGATP